MRRLLLASTLAIAVSACSGGGGESAKSSPTPLPSVASAIDFPLYSGSRVLVAKSFTQVVNTSDPSYNGVLMSGNGTYKGNEQVASSPASFDQLRAWLRGLNGNLPNGYTVVQSAQYNEARNSVQRYGLDFALFQKSDGAKPPQGLLVLVMDPARVTKSIGPALPLISKYRSLPDFAKKPIDDQVKAQTGFSVTEALQPESPIGLALETLNDFSHSNQRAILMVNAQKQ